MEMKLPVIGIIIALLTTTLSLAPILLQQQSSGAVTGGSLNPTTRYCVVGTGAGTNRACIPCDIGLGAGNCRDTLTGSTPCPRYGPPPPNCTLDPFSPLNQVPGTTVTPAPGVLDPTLGPAGGGVIQQQPALIPAPPPLFGRNLPLQGGEAPGQQPAAIVPPSPVLTPEPPVPQFGQIAPLGQVPLSLDEETQEQASEEQTTEEDEQVLAKDDDDGPVPPECPTTGPIPPDCTMKPKFPEERAIE
jgi:hypothetical protein